MRLGEGPRTRASQHHAPSPGPCQFSAGPEGGGFLTRLRPCELSEESLRLPPTSFARTTNLALPCAPESSGYTRSFPPAGLTQSGTVFPSTTTVRGAVASDTKVVSTAICAPWLSGKPSATTSSRRASACWSGNRSKSLTSTFVDTRAPASRHTRAAALSRANPRRPSTPACTQAARWWPLGCQRRRRSST